MTASSPEIVGTFGMVSSTHWLATAVAMSVLERGGNAFDAVVAGGFALHAAQPQQNGPGGEAPAIIWSADEQRTRVLNGQGTAPALASITRYTDLGLSAVPGTGLLAATTPGAVGSWLLLLAEYGTFTLRDVLEPAISLLRTGIWAGSHLRGELASVEELFTAEWSTSEELWGGAQRASSSGDLVKNPTLAATYERLLSEAESASGDREAQIEAARVAWYSGFVAEAIDRFSRETAWLDTSGERHSGLITGDDMATWRAAFEAPLTYDYHGTTVAKADAWSQGPVFLQQLALLEGFPLGTGELSEEEETHIVIEASKLAYADRDAWYGGSAEADIITALLDPAYSAARRDLIGLTASTELRAGSPLGRTPRFSTWTPDVAASALSAGAGEPNRAGAGEPNRVTSTVVYGDTCHIDVADSFGNMVSATPSGGWLQSSPAIPGLGFCLGTRAQMFWLEPGLPTSLVPGTRPRTTLSPGLALRDGTPWMAFGTPGGDQQDQWALGFFLGVVHGAGGLRGAMDRPRFQSEHVWNSFYPRVALPNRLVIESDWAPAVLDGLAARGHDLVEVPAGTLGKVTAVTREGSLLRAVADSRAGEPYAAGR
jgi:gamma-glutamyltranspeptidase/glutathione hydrolase